MKNVCYRILQEEGYVPTYDDDGDIKFKAQGCTLYVIAPEKDDIYLRVLLPGFWSLENEEEFAKAHFVANKLTKDYKVGKIYLDKEDTHASCEVFIDKNDAQLKRSLLRLVNLVLSMRQDFANEMRA